MVSLAGGGEVLSLLMCHPHFTQVPRSCLAGYPKAAGYVSCCYIRMQLYVTPDPLSPILFVS
ncbi:hypothetical protein KSK55_10265 [Methanospirillum purgamenti]|uniref:Uncharacterized protein n=1 Tax=Methanospirillum hungatei TaxID=2203 RepID=A0A8F5VIR3_METHU|nr:hypothetical protein [Methanospirillum hungatei]QXO93737.1 hypothetical protein KSK55_10265 [Methanospirillum hungatei]